MAYQCHKHEEIKANLRDNETANNTFSKRLGYSTSQHFGHRIAFTMLIVTYTAAHVLAPESTTLFNDLVCLLDLAFASDPVVNWLFKNYSNEEFLKKLT